jgi:hypothetical protein
MLYSGHHHILCYSVRDHRELYHYTTWRNNDRCCHSTWNHRNIHDAAPRKYRSVYNSVHRHFDHSLGPNSTNSNHRRTHGRSHNRSEHNTYPIARFVTECIRLHLMHERLSDRCDSHETRVPGICGCQHGSFSRDQCGCLSRRKWTDHKFLDHCTTGAFCRALDLGLPIGHTVSATIPLGHLRAITDEELGHTRLFMRCMKTSVISLSNQYLRAVKPQRSVLLFLHLLTTNH